MHCARRVVILLLWAATCLSPWGVRAQEDGPVEGSVVKGQVTIGRSTLALPPGDWTVAAVVWDTVNLGGVGQFAGAKVFSGYVVQTDSDDNLVAAFYYMVPTGPSNAQRPWQYERICGRGDTLHREQFKGSKSQQECLIINHLVPFFQYEAAVGSVDRKFMDWLRGRKIKLPAQALAAFYINFVDDMGIRAFAYVNPELLGIERVAVSKWGDSPWHPKQIASDPRKVALVDRFKQWSDQFVANSRSALLHRKPLEAGLPAFDSLKP